jgi:hypothetical protein
MSVDDVLWVCGWCFWITIHDYNIQEIKLCILFEEINLPRSFFSSENFSSKFSINFWHSVFMHLSSLLYCCQQAIMSQIAGSISISLIYNSVFNDSRCDCFGIFEDRIARQSSPLPRRAVCNSLMWKTHCSLQCLPTSSTVRSENAPPVRTGDCPRQQSCYFVSIHS